MCRNGSKYKFGSGRDSIPEKAKNDPFVCWASDLNAFALAETKNSSPSTNQTKTRTLDSTARLASGAMVLSMFESSRCGVMNRMARFIPSCAVGRFTVSRAMDNVCRLGVELRKSGLNEFKLTNQSLMFACEMSEPDNETRLKSSCDSGGWEFAQLPRVSRIREKRGVPELSRTSSARRSEEHTSE